MPLVRVGTKLFQEKDFSSTFAQECFTENPMPLPTSPELWAGRKEPLLLNETKLRQCKFGELRSVATVSRPDMCARLARIASKINALRGSDVYRTSELARLVEEWNGATALKYASPPRPWRALGGGGKAKDGLCHRGEGAHCGSMSLVGWSDSAIRFNVYGSMVRCLWFNVYGSMVRCLWFDVYGDQLAEGKCRLGYAIG